MANNSIGGFFVTLGMKVDQSFKAGEEAVSKFLGTAGKASAAAVVLAKVAGVVENSNLKLAKAIGISGEDLKAWQDTVSKAGVSAGAFTSSMSQLENKMQKLKLGEIDEGLAKNLGMLGIGYDQFANMDASSRVASVYNAARAMQDQGKAATLVGEVLGSAGREYYDWLALSGSTLSEELAQAKSLNFTTEESMKSAMAFNAEFNSLMNSTKSIGMLIGSKIGEKLTPVAKTVKEILRDNKEFIASGIIGVVDVLGKIGSAMGDVMMTLTGADSVGEAFQKIIDGVKKFAGPAIDTSILMIKDLAAALRALFDGDWSALGNNLSKFFEDLGVGVGALMGSTAEKAVDKQKSAKEKFDSGDYVGGAIDFVGGAVTAATSEKTAFEKELDEKGYGGIVPKNFKDFPIDILEKAVEEKKAGRIGDYFSRYFDLETLALLDGWAKNPESFEKFKTAKSATEGNMNVGAGASGTDRRVRALRNSAAQKRIDDGIVSPDGRVTQVAPDDWVIAARNLGDVASAFMPRSVAAMSGNTMTSSCVINQSFSFSGKADSAEVMRQAYKGTQNGLLAAMNRSTERLQLMPGLR